MQCSGVARRPTSPSAWAGRGRWGRGRLRCVAGPWHSTPTHACSCPHHFLRADLQHSKVDTRHGGASGGHLLGSCTGKHPSSLAAAGISSSSCGGALCLQLGQLVMTRPLMPCCRCRCWCVAAAAAPRSDCTGMQGRRHVCSNWWHHPRSKEEHTVSGSRPQLACCQRAAVGQPAKALSMIH